MIRVLGQLPVFALALLVFAPTAAHAQAVGWLRFETGGGFALPTNNPYSLRTGYQIQAAVETNSPGLPIALRLEGLFARFGYEHTFQPRCSGRGAKCAEIRRSQHERIIAGTLNVLVQPSVESWPGLEVVPYLIAGGGFYDHKNSAGGAGSGIDPGVNGGLGIRIPKIHAFVEARMHFVIGTQNFVDSGYYQPPRILIPIAFGLAW